MERQKVTKTHPDRKILSYLCIKPTRMKTRNTITVQPYTSPCGRLLLGSFNDKLCLCDWQVEKHRERVNERLKRILCADFKEGVSELTARAARQLDEYFTGKRRTFDIPLLFTGTDFQQKVWNELPCIHYGHTMSYGEMAAKMGMPDAVRAVANANGANPISIIVPCHRVIGSNKSLTGDGGGLAAKEYLLQQERGNIEPGLFHQYFFV